MPLWKLRGCHYCDGDLFREYDENYNIFYSCLQCGRTEMKEIPQFLIEELLNKRGIKIESDSY